MLRTLVEFPRSSMRWWGSGRRRWEFYLGPGVLLALIPALCLGAIMFSYRIRRGIFTASPIELLRIPANRYGWYSMILVFSAVAGIVIPLGPGRRGIIRPRR